MDNVRECTIFVPCTHRLPFNGLGFFASYPFHSPPFSTHFSPIRLARPHSHPHPTSQPTTDPKSHQLPQQLGLLSYIVTHHGSRMHLSRGHRRWAPRQLPHRRTLPNSRRVDGALSPSTLLAQTPQRIIRNTLSRVLRSAIHDGS